MGKMTAITAEVDDVTLAVLDRMAVNSGQSLGECLAEVGRRFADHEEELIAFAQKGLADVEAGRVVMHEQMIERLRARQAKRAVA